MKSGNPWYRLLHGETVIPMGSSVCQQSMSGLVRIWAFVRFCVITTTGFGS